MPFPEAAKTLGQRGAGEGSHELECDSTLACAAHRVHRVDPVARRRDQRFRMREEGAAGVGEDDATGKALEELRTHLALKEMDAAADRGLRHVKAGRRQGESPEPDDRQER